MKRKLFAITAGLLLMVPAACLHPGHRGAPGGRGHGCPKHQGCDCTCRHKTDRPAPPDCPQQRLQEPPLPAK